MTTKTQTGLVTRFAERFGIEPGKLLGALKATAFRQRSSDTQITDEQMMALLVVANEYGLNPFTKEIYAYPDKQNGIVPVVSVDGWVRIANEHREFDGLEFDYGPKVPAGTLDGQVVEAREWVAAIVFRKDRCRPTRAVEYLDEAYRRPVTKKDRDGKPYTVVGPWQTHTKRMLRHRAMIQAFRMAFGFSGIYEKDEAVAIVERDITDETQVVERTTLKDKIRRTDEPTTAPENADEVVLVVEQEQEPAEDGAVEVFEVEEDEGAKLMAEANQASTLEELDFVRSAAKERLRGTALRDVQETIWARAKELRESE